MGSRYDNPPRFSKSRALALPVIAVAGTSLLFAACSSSNKSTTSAATNPPATTAAPATTVTPATPPSDNSAVTVKAVNVPGVGMALVNGDGRTLYVLASEKGGKVSCTASGGCTTIWPPVVLPAGMMHGIAGSGVQASLLGTVNGPTGDVQLTYAGWPLYTFSEDTSSNPAKGQGVKDSYGQWWALSPSGNPITTAAATSSPTTSGASTGGAGF